MSIHLLSESPKYSNSVWTDKVLFNQTPSGWIDFFSTEKTKNLLIKIQHQISLCKETVYPHPDNVFRAFYLTSLNKIKVCIIGLDPYSDGAAVGLSFCVLRKKINGSLLNIAKEVKSCGFNVEPNCGNLFPWAEQGVFLINTALTVKEGTPESHIGIWREFTQSLMEYMSEHNKDIIFILWGKKAEALSSYMGDCTKLTFVHPSPLSAHRGFIGSKCFTKINAELKLKNKTSIDWSILQK